MSEQKIERQINEWIDKKLEEYEVDEDRLRDLRAKVECYTGIKKYWHDYMKHLKRDGLNGPKVWEWCEREEKSIITVLEHYKKQKARQDLMYSLKEFRDKKESKETQ